MGISQKQEFSAVLFMILCGVLCGILYDIVRISRVLLRISAYSNTSKKLSSVHFPLIGMALASESCNIPFVLKNILLAAGDMLFGVVGGCLFSVFLAHYASGIFRWFFLFSAGFGFFLYYFSFGRVVMIASEGITAIIRVILLYVQWLLLLPFRIILSAAKILICNLYQKLLIPVKVTAAFRAALRYTEKIKNELPTELTLSCERSD